MFGIGMGELILILIIAFVVVGPAELPKAARWLGRAVRSARRAVKDLSDAVDAEELKKLSKIEGIEEIAKIEDLKELHDELKENIKL
jgi:Tat protein translocase TatB subunit